MANESKLTDIRRGTQHIPSHPGSDAIVRMARELLDIDYPVIELHAPEDEKNNSKLESGAYTIVIQNANSPTLDSVKERFFELGLVGGNAQAGEAPIWFGTTRLVEENNPGSGKLAPLIVSYYTIGTGYENCAAYFRRSMQKFNFDYELIGIDPRGSWEDNCAYKPLFIRDMWRQSKRPIIWLDADATLEAHPSWFFRTGADFAFHKWRGVEFSTGNEKFGWELGSGTLFFNRSEEAGALLDAWCNKCIANPATWDQVHLDMAWAQVNFERRIKTLFLPQRYLQIFDRPDFPGEGTAVIKHWQASRKFKAEVSGGTARQKHKIDEDYVRARRYARFPEEAPG